MPNLCPNCGTKIEAMNARFCPNCGCSLQTVTISEPRANMVTSKRLIIPSLLTALMATIISFLSVKLNYYPNSPIVLFIPFIASIIGILVYFRLVYRNEINMTGRESIVFGLLSAIFWTLFTSILGATIFVGVYNYGWSTSSIAPSLMFGFAVFTCGAFFCSIILPPIGLSLGKLPPPPPLNVPSIQKRKLFSMIVFVLVLVLPIVMFPTTHIRSVNQPSFFPFRYNVGGQFYQMPLFGGQSTKMAWGMRSWNSEVGESIFRTVVDIQSTQNVLITIVIEELYYSSADKKVTERHTHVCYSENAKVHKSSFQFVTDDFQITQDVQINYNVTAKNSSPLLFPSGVFPTPIFKNGTITFSPPITSGQIPLYMNGSVNVTREYQSLQWTEWWKP